jgi:hypothetical protein
MRRETYGKVTLPVGERLSGSHWLQSRSEHSEEEKYLFALPEIEPRFLDRPASDVTTIPTELFQLRILYIQRKTF